MVACDFCSRVAKPPLEKRTGRVGSGPSVCHRTGNAFAIVLPSGLLSGLLSEILTPASLRALLTSSFTLFGEFALPLLLALRAWLEVEPVM